MNNFFNSLIHGLLLSINVMIIDIMFFVDYNFKPTYTDFLNYITTINSNSNEKYKILDKVHKIKYNALVVSPISYTIMDHFFVKRGVFVDIYEFAKCLYILFFHSVLKTFIIKESRGIVIMENNRYLLNYIVPFVLLTYITRPNQLTFFTCIGILYLYNPLFYNYITKLFTLSLINFTFFGKYVNETVWYYEDYYQIYVNFEHAVGYINESLYELGFYIQKRMDSLLFWDIKNIVEENMNAIKESIVCGNLSHVFMEREHLFGENNTTNTDNTNKTNNINIIEEDGITNEHDNDTNSVTSILTDASKAYSTHINIEVAQDIGRAIMNKKNDSSSLSTYDDYILIDA
jgi:hypothetical protein